MSTSCPTPSSPVKPHYTISSSATAHTVQVDLPGIPKSGIQVEVEKDILSIQGSGRPAWPESWRPLHQELSPADYSLKLRVDASIQTQQIKASHENGVLTLELPLQEAAQPRRIELN